MAEAGRTYCVAILGGGNGAYAAAADLAEQGHQVRLWRRNGAALAPLKQLNGLNVKDHRGTRLIRLAEVTDDIAAAVRGADIVVIPLPAFAQLALAESLAPVLQDGQIVFLPPGTFNSVYLAEKIRAFGCRAYLYFAETGTLPYLARKHGDDTIAITTRATRLPTGVFPACHAEKVLARLSALYPAIETVEDALSAALMNAGPVIHPPLVIMNAGAIQHFDHWDIHNEGTQPAIRRVTTALDNERIAVREKLKYRAPHFPLADHYDDTGPEWMYGNLAHDRLVDSGDWRETLDLNTHRYVQEDVLMGLDFLASVARWCDVQTPVANGLLSLGRAMLASGTEYCSIDFSSSPVAAYAPNTVSAFLEHGWPAGMSSNA